MHDFHSEIKTAWHVGEWAKRLNFVREIHCHGEPTVPNGALLVASVQAGSSKSYRVYFLLPPKAGRLDGIGEPRPAIGRPVRPAIHPRASCSRPRAKPVPREVIQELQKAFGVYRPSTIVKLCSSFPHWLLQSRILLSWFRAQLLSRGGALVSQWHQAISTACRVLRWE
jgi:hypothetical protein